MMQFGSEDYISLTDMMRSKDGEFFFHNWLRNRNTVEFLGTWEKVFNPEFNSAEFDIIKSKAGLNNFRLSTPGRRKSRESGPGDVPPGAVCRENEMPGHNVFCKIRVNSLLLKFCLQSLAGFSNGGGRNPKQDGLLRYGELKVRENVDAEVSFGEPRVGFPEGFRG